MGPERCQRPHEMLDLCWGCGPAHMLPELSSIRVLLVVGSSCHPSALLWVKESNLHLVSSKDELVRQFFLILALTLTLYFL